MNAETLKLSGGEIILRIHVAGRKRTNVITRIAMKSFRAKVNYSACWGANGSARAGRERAGAGAKWQDA